MQMSPFKTAKQLLTEHTNEQLIVNITQSTKTIQTAPTIEQTKQLQTVAQLESLKNSEPNQPTIKQYTIRIQNKSGEQYSEVLIYTFTNSPAALIAWINIVNKDHRGYTIGRTLHKEAVTFINSNTSVKRIYTNIQNTRMKTVTIETGFQPITHNSGQWYLKEYTS